MKFPGDSSGVTVLPDVMSDEEFIAYWREREAELAEFDDWDVSDIEADEVVVCLGCLNDRVLHNGRGYFVPCRDCFAHATAAELAEAVRTLCRRRYDAPL